VSPATSTIIWSTLVLAGVTIVLLLVVASQLHSYTQSGIGGWNLSFNILTARASPFGTPAGGWAIILAVWGFLLVPALAGAVAALILGAYLTRSQAALDHAIDMANRRSTERLQAAKSRIEEAKARKVKAENKEVEAAKVEGEAAAAEARHATSQPPAQGGQPPAQAPPVQDGIGPTHG
jgi:hypothetical protein